MVKTAAALLKKADNLPPEDFLKHVRKVHQGGIVKLLLNDISLKFVVVNDVFTIIIIISKILKYLGHDVFTI
jgi:hypothetical protein